MHYILNGFSNTLSRTHLLTIGHASLFFSAIVAIFVKNFPVNVS